MRYTHEVRKPRYSATIRVTMLPNERKSALPILGHNVIGVHLRMGCDAHIIRPEPSVEPHETFILGDFPEAIRHAAIR